MSFKRLQFWFNRHRVDIAWVVVILIVAGLPRLLDLGLFLTADEKNWIGRAYEFIRAFKDFRFNDMIQTSHPGVTALWIMGLAITAKMLVGHIPFSFSNLYYFVKAAQFPIALSTTLCIPITYVLLRKLLKTRLVPVVTTLFIALDPLLIGYSRVAHIDVLLMHLMFLAGLSLLIYAQENYSRRWLVAAAVWSGLAMLTKVPAVFLVPYFGLILLVWGGFKKSWPTINDRVRDVVRWLLIIGFLFVTLWPAIIWVDNPIGNVLIIKRDVAIAASTPHDMTEDYSVDANYYMYALLTRTTPIAFVLAIVAVIWLLIVSIRSRNWRHWQIEWFMVAYAFFFILMMTLGAKKGDRYILPAWPAIDLLAVWAGVWITQWLFKRWPVAMKYSPNIWLSGFIILTIGYLGVTDWQYHPYDIAYSNPLFPPNLGQELGWGEGLDQVANWLNTNHPNAVVASWYPEELGAFTTARVAHINAHEQNNVQFVVLYRNMFGRAPDYYSNDFIDEYYKKKMPVFVAHVAGREFAWVYEKRVYENIIGEITPGKVVSQTVATTRPNLTSFDIAIATYSGKATAGDITVTLQDMANKKIIQTWQVAVKDIEDAKWQKFQLDQPLPSAPQTLQITMQTSGTSAGNAPTIRYTKTHDYRPGTWTLNGTPQPGDLAIRLRYKLDATHDATEEDTLLLEGKTATRPR